MLARIKYYLTFPWNYYKNKRAMKKKLEELRKKDPFIYE
jgi:hypothetical protein